MSKKLTKEMIEELIKEELAKVEQERLDEFKVTINSTDDWYKLKNKIGITSLKKINRKDVPTAFNDIKNLAGLKTPTDDLDDDDFQKAYDDRSTNTSNWQLTQDIVKNTSKKASGEIGKWKPSTSPPSGSWGTTAAGLASLPDPNSAVAPTKSGRPSKTALATWFKNTVLPELQKPANSPRAAAYLNDYVAELNKIYGSNFGKSVNNALNAIRTALGSSPPVTGGDVAKTGIAAIIKALNPDIDIDNRKFADLLGGQAQMKIAGSKGLATASASTISKANVYADSSLLAQFGIFQGKNAGEIIGALKETADDIANKKFSGIANQFEFLVKANLVNKLAILGKQFEESPAGFELEKYCALLFGGLQVGGDTGAVDVYSILSDGTVGAYSQKFYNEPENIHQAVSGLEDYFNNGEGTPIYYFIAGKGDKTTGRTKSGKAYNEIRLFIVQLSKKSPSTPTTTGEGYVANVMNLTGTTLSPGTSYPCMWSGGHVYMGKKATGGAGTAASTGNKSQIGQAFTPTAVIPIMNTKSEDATAVAEYFAKQLTSGTPTSNPIKKLSQNLINVQKRLKNMELNSDEYVAKKAGSRFGGLKGTDDYIDQLATDYTEMKDEYKEIFTIAGDFGSASTKAQTAFAESKMKELDLMIENMVKQFLKGN